MLELSDFKEKADKAAAIIEKLNGKHKAVFTTADGLIAYRDVMNAGNDPPKIGDKVKYEYYKSVLGIQGKMVREYSFVGYQSTKSPLTGKVDAIPSFVEVVD